MEGDERAENDQEVGVGKADAHQEIQDFLNRPANDDEVSQFSNSESQKEGERQDVSVRRQGGSVGGTKTSRHKRGTSEQNGNERCRRQQIEKDFC